MDMSANKPISSISFGAVVAIPLLKPCLYGDHCQFAITTSFRLQCLVWTASDEMKVRPTRLFSQSNTVWSAIGIIMSSVHLSVY